MTTRLVIYIDLEYEIKINYEFPMQSRNYTVVYRYFDSVQGYEKCLVGLKRIKDDNMSRRGGIKKEDGWWRLKKWGKEGAKKYSYCC